MSDSKFYDPKADRQAAYDRAAEIALRELLIEIVKPVLQDTAMRANRKGISEAGQMATIQTCAPMLEGIPALASSIASKHVEARDLWIESQREKKS